MLWSMLWTRSYMASVVRFFLFKEISFQHRKLRQLSTQFVYCKMAPNEKNSLTITRQTFDKMDLEDEGTEIEQDLFFHRSDLKMPLRLRSMGITLLISCSFRLNLYLRKVCRALIRLPFRCSFHTSLIWCSIVSIAGVQNPSMSLLSSWPFLFHHSADLIHESSSPSSSTFFLSLLFSGEAAWK